jgi:hypothetical protein
MFPVSIQELQDEEQRACLGIDSRIPLYPGIDG